MTITEQRFIRKPIQLARDEGRLIDLSHEARTVGLQFRCEVGEHLWDSLFWKYPSADENDVIAVGELLAAFRAQFEHAPTQDTFFVRPPRLPHWMGPSYSLKVLVLYQSNEIESAVIMSKDDTLSSLFSSARPLLPATLFVKLMLACRSLLVVARTSERAGIRALQATVYTLLRTSPLFPQIEQYLATLDPPTLPHDFSHDEYRDVLCRSFLELLGVAAAVADHMGSDLKLPVSGVLQLLVNQLSMMPLQPTTAPFDKVVFLH